MTVAQFPIAASGADGFTEQSDILSIYPPNGTVTADTTDPNVIAEQFFSTPQYLTRCGLLRFDTSSLPDGIVISSASLTGWVTSTGDADGRNFALEWYDPGTIGTEDHTNGSSATAGSFAVSGITSGAYNTWALTDPAANIDGAGFTGLRLTIDGGAPTGGNSVAIASFDNVIGKDPPTLAVTYSFVEKTSTLATDLQSVMVTSVEVPVTSALAADLQSSMTTSVEVPASSAVAAVIGSVLSSTMERVDVVPMPFPQIFDHKAAAKDRLVEQFR